ncbi:hypothetical protein BC834DRAFT_678804 [Gloeopeniophorella convolvens]|nr:hypothetical protein BC834DRAFT_678804 [Gloeopeniophorella convolvens]
MNRPLPTVPQHSPSRSIDSSRSAVTVDVHKVIHTYNLRLGGADVRLSITIEPSREFSHEHVFLLSLKTGAVERPISQPVYLKLSLDPRTLSFSVFAFPPRSSLPQGCLFSLRVWLRTGDIDHRLFSEDTLWIGKEPDFYSIEDATFARLRNSSTQTVLYKAAIGRGLIDIIVKWKAVFGQAYSLSLEYEGNGIGRVLFNDYILRLDCPPEDLDFVIYTIPVLSTPRGATHRIRVWLRVPTSSADSVPSLSSAGPSREYVYQRIWSTDDFKVGSSLDFTALGPKLIMAVPSGNGPKTLTSPSERSFYHDDGPAGAKQPTYGENTNGRKEVF